jgi:hypothetical protein
VCAADAQRRSLLHEGPGQAYRAVRDGAMLVTGLLNAFCPLAGEFMTTQLCAAAHLLTKLRVRASVRAVTRQFLRTSTGNLSAR